MGHRHLATPLKPSVTAVGNKASGLARIAVRHTCTGEKRPGGNQLAVDQAQIASAPVAADNGRAGRFERSAVQELPRASVSFRAFARYF